MVEDRFFLGIDFGTSGARAIVIDVRGKIRASAQRPFAEACPPADVWQTVLWQLFEDLPAEARAHVGAVALNGTSATVLLCDRDGQPLHRPLYYNDRRATAAAETIVTVAPTGHVTCGATSSLAKLLWLQEETDCTGACYFLHQADWLGFLLHGQLGRSDYHNALKLGCDPATGCYPSWLLELLKDPSWLPQVQAPGTEIASLLLSVSERFGFPADCLVRAGTTDSIAAFLASGVRTPGDAVTSLGSTLVLKLLSDRRVDDARFGIYSHRLGDLWLVGGASNTGGAVLRHFFSNAELVQLSDRIVPERESPLRYYPLLAPGERFPINDPALAPCLDPRPEDPAAFLHGLFESMARIEAQGYRCLQELGSTPLACVYTAGGGAQNPVWQGIRSRQLGLPVRASIQTEAAYGTALLARGLEEMAQSAIEDRTNS